MGLESLVCATSDLVEFSSVESLHALAEGAVGVIRMMYGETFDDLGVPVDGLKYYAWLSLVGSALEDGGRDVRPLVVVADDAVRVNLETAWGSQKIAMLAQRRCDFVSRFSALCSGSAELRPVLMSSEAAAVGFDGRRSAAASLLQTSDEFHSAVRASVREDHIEKEELAGYQYSLDEVALISAFQVKVGPPRERFYDDAARVLNRERGERPLQSVLLTPSYPLATSPGDYVRDRELRLYGVTAYKAGSLGFSRRRLVVGRDNVNQLEELLHKTKIVRRAGAPNALQELARVLQLVAFALSGEAPEVWLSDAWSNDEISDDGLKAECKSLYEQFIDQIVTPACGAGGVSSP